MATQYPNSNPNSFDPVFLLRGLTSFFSLLGKNDRAALSTVFEQTFRALDDGYHELNQINASKDFLTVDPYLQRDWLLRDLTKAEFIGTPHGHFDLEFVAVGGETTFVIGRPVDTGQATMFFINGVETPQGDGWTFDTSVITNPGIVLTNPALPGDVFRLYAADVNAIAIYTADGVQQTFLFPSDIDVRKVRIFHDQVEITQGAIQIFKRYILLKGGLTGGEIVQFRRGAQLHNVTAAAGQVRVDCPFDIDASTIIRLGGINIRDGWVVQADKVIFKTPPRVGVVIKIEGPRQAPHDHEIYQAVSTMGQTVFNTPTPLGLDPGFVPNINRPILVVINGVLAPTSFYNFTGASQITFTSGLLAGEQIQIYYHNTTDFSHAHPDYEATLVEDLKVGTPINLVFLDGDKPAYVLIDGVLIPNGLGTNAYQVQGGSIIFGQTLPAGTRVFILAEKFQWRYRMTKPNWDVEIVWVSSIQNGIDLPTVVLLPQTDYIIIDGVIYLNEVFENAWLKDSRIDLQTPYNNFGYLIDFQQQTSQAYLDLLRALWAAYTGGTLHYVIENFGRIMLGSPAAQVAGVVQSIETTGNISKIEILGDDGVLRKFTLTGMPVGVIVSQRVDRFTALGKGMNVIDEFTEPNWYRRFPLFLYAIERFSSGFETAALLDKGVTATYRISAITDYDALTHSIVVTPTAFDFKLVEDLNRKAGRATIFQGSNRFDSRIIPSVTPPGGYPPAVEDLGWGFRITFDPAYTFAVPPASGVPTFVEFEFEKQRRLDVDFIFDEYIKEHLDPVATQVYSVLRANLFALEITPDLRVAQDRLELLFKLIERVRAVETNYLVLGELPALSDDVPVDITESDPTSAANFAQIPAYLIYNVSAYGIGWYVA